ncbi:MAG: hypothetical protein KME06_02810 [Kastovskya adunca ATA6-11-RM4]|jgi:hypothetical protein|nr:hypothetical protein [Kastovskya adunca ATA6-11-RM4]
MTEESRELSHALFAQEREYIKDRLGDETWIKVYHYSQNVQDTKFFYSGLIPNECVPEALQTTNWEVDISSGFPGCVRFGNGTVEYSRFGIADAEPLVFIRDYVGFRESHPEISEEFRFFHNLYHEPRKNEFLKFDESGEEETIIRFQNETILIRLKQIRQFIAIKNAHLALLFDYIRYSNLDISTVPEDQRRGEYNDEQTIYQFGVTETSSYSNYSTVSYLHGKKLLLPYPKSKSGVWPYSEDETEIYEEFQIGETPDGDPITFTCNGNKLANNFGANPDAPHYLTPVYFKRDVLQKYYNDPERFSVEDSYLRCGVSWGLRMDNNHENVVIVYLGDLGRDLPAKERAYWKVFNITPKGSLSTTKYMRDFLGVPFDPQGKDLNFKQRYKQLNQKWKAKYGWSLFRELSSEDSHFFQNLRVPLNNSQSEFDLQILTLAKVLIDALNENEIGKNISSIPDPPRGIAKFAVFLEEKNFVDCQEGLALLRDIQNIRSSGVAHLKGSNYSKLVKRLQLSEKELQRVFCDLLEQSAKFLEKLSSDIEQQSTV